MSIGSRRTWLLGVPIFLIAIACYLWPDRETPGLVPPTSFVVPAPASTSNPQPLPPVLAWEAPADAGTTARVEPMFDGDGALVITVERAGIPVAGADVRLYFDPNPPIIRDPNGGSPAVRPPPRTGRRG